MPAVMPAGTATTQPMPMPRTGSIGLKTSAGLKPARPGIGQTRATQRIVLPTPPGTRNTKSLNTVGMPNGRINLPIGMILRCLPTEVLAEEISKFEANGKAATEVGLPMNMILSQLPSGKVEMTLQDLLPHFPPGFLQPTESITNYLPSLVSLPLMDVVMRIPPDLLALRPDQKDVDAAVINMADPFTEEILREQAEAARRQSQTNIIEESQAPQEEFVPRDQAKTIVPPRRPAAEPLAPARTAATTLGASLTPPATRPPPPTPSGSVRMTPSVPTPSIPTPTPLTPSPSGRIPMLNRSTQQLPPRAQSAVTMPIDAGTSAPSSLAPIPPVPRGTGRIPAPPPPKHTTTLPVPRRTGSLAALSQSAATVPIPQGSTSSASTAPSAPAAPEAAAPTDDLQRLAALAMAQLGDENTESDDSAEDLAAKTKPLDRLPTPEIPVEEPEAAPVPTIAAAPEPMVTPLPRPEPVAAQPAAVASQPIAAPKPRTATQALPDLSPEQAASVAFNLNTCTAEDLVKNIPDCSEDLAKSIIQHRDKIGSFKRLEELLDVPGITKAAYTNLTGEAPPDNRIPLSLNELLGFPGDQHTSLKDVAERIACWPDVTGCVLSQSSGLSLVGTVAPGVNKAAIVAFAPRMFEAINKSFHEVSDQETDALVIPTTGTSFHLFRNRDLYLIIMSRLPQMPERHVKVARFVLAALSVRRD